MEKTTITVKAPVGKTSVEGPKPCCKKETCCKDNVPKELHCFRCKGKQPIKDVEIQDTHFKSTRFGIAMTRESWVAKCATCGATVRSFKSH